MSREDEGHLQPSRRGCGGSRVGGQDLVELWSSPSPVRLPWLTKGGPVLRWSGRRRRQPLVSQAADVLPPLLQPILSFFASKSPTAMILNLWEAAALPWQQPQPAGGSSGRTGPARCRSLHSVRGQCGPGLQQGPQHHHSHQLWPPGTGPKPRQGPSPPRGRAGVDRPPPGGRWLLSLAPPWACRTPPLHGCRPGWHCHLLSSATGPGSRVDEAWSSGWAHPIGVYVCACDVTSSSCPQPRGLLHRQCRHGLGRGPRAPA